MNFIFRLILGSFLINVLVWSLFVVDVYALNLGTNITIYDGQTSNTYSSSTTKMGYDGIGQDKEDQETEPNTLRSEDWDLEGVFLNGTVLSLVGQWNFINGEDGASSTYDKDGDGKYTSGDIFINTDTDSDYEYVFDVDWLSKKYTLYGIISAQLINPSYKTPDSDPWKIDVSKSTLKNLSNGYLTLGTDSSDQFYGNSIHNVVSGFDLMPILLDLDVDSLDFKVHFTMECGNDEMEGQGTAPVPEPATVILMGIGLIGVAGFGRKKIKKQA